MQKQEGYNYEDDELSPEVQAQLDEPIIYIGDEDENGNP